MIIREDKEKVMGFSIVDGEKTVPILVERESFSGIRRIAVCLRTIYVRYAGKNQRLLTRAAWKVIPEKSL